jgi:hypothetical protein
MPTDMQLEPAGLSSSRKTQRKPSGKRMHTLPTPMPVFSATKGVHGQDREDTDTATITAAGDWLIITEARREDRFQRRYQGAKSDVQRRQPVKDAGATR